MFFACAPGAAAQAKGKAAAGADVYDCGGGITVRFFPARGVQGGLLRLEVHGQTGLAKVTGDWVRHEGENKIHYFALLADNSDYFEIRYDSREMTWQLTRVWMEG